jgi:hypothetical protein
VRAEESKGIGVAGGKDGVNLRVQARIAGCNRYSVLHGWALLRQVGRLPHAANMARSGELGLNPDVCLLNCRALAGKCQAHGKEWLNYIERRIRFLVDRLAFIMDSDLGDFSNGDCQMRRVRRDIQSETPRLA